MLRAQAKAQAEQDATAPEVEQVTQGGSSTLETRNMAEDPQVIEVLISASLSVEQLSQSQNNNPSVKSPPVVIQDSVMQSQTNMSDFLGASTAGCNLLDQFMVNMGAHMDMEFIT